MRTLVVLSIAFAVASAAPTGEQEHIEPAQPGHAEKRSIGHAVAIVDPSIYLAPAATFYSGPSAVSHQSREDVHTSQIVVSGTPVVAAHSVEAFPPSAVISPVQTVFQAPSVHSVPVAVSHQSRVDSKISSLVALEPSVVANSAVVQSVPTVVEDLPSVVDARSVYVVPASHSLYQPIVYSTIW